MRIYLVTDEGLLLGKDLYRTVEAAVKGGVSMVQLREKESSTRKFIERAIRLKEVLTPYGVTAGRENYRLIRGITGTGAGGQ